MLDISPHAFSGIAAHEEARFVRKLATFLREKVPSLASEAPEAVEAQCRLLMQRSRGFDMKSEQAVAVFAMTAAVLGLDFVERFPAARQILFRPVSQERKAELLQGFTVKLLDTLRKG